MSPLWIPYLSVVFRNLSAEKIYIWHKGVQVAIIKRLSTRVYPLSATIIANSAQFHIRKHSIFRLDYLVPHSVPEDFTIGVEGDPQPLEFEIRVSPEDINKATAIFNDVFGGDMKRLGQWIYNTRFPSLENDGRLTSKTLRIPAFCDKHVFVADGRLYNVKSYGSQEPFEPSANLRIEDINMAGIPLVYWLLLMKPAEFHPTAPTCIALKKIVNDQAKKLGHPYLSKYLWLSNGTEMVEARIFNAKVSVGGRYLTPDQINELFNRTNDMWVGNWGTIRKLFV
jgi:hypothetical protein